mgnify:CR=1 FL=1
MRSGRLAKVGDPASASDRVPSGAGPLLAAHWNKNVAATHLERLAADGQRLAAAEKGTDGRTLTPQAIARCAFRAAECGERC